MTKLLVLAAFLSLAACGKKEQSADVDCAKLMDHMADVTVKGIADPAKQDTARARMKDARPHLIESCEQEKPTKKMTVAQYDCVMKAPTLAEFQACLQ